MKAADWIDRAKQARGWHSDYLAAKELGLHRNSIANYRARAMTLDDETAIRVAGVLGIAPEVVMLDQAQERAKSDEVREVLGRVLARLGVKPLKGGGHGAGGASVAPESAAARVNITSAASTRPAKGAARNSVSDGDDLYIVSTGNSLARLARAISSWLALPTMASPGGASLQPG